MQDLCLIDQLMHWIILLHDEEAIMLEKRRDVVKFWVYFHKLAVGIFELDQRGKGGPP